MSVDTMEVKSTLYANTIESTTINNSNTITSFNITSTQNITANKINGKVYPQAQPPQSSVVPLDINAGVYNSLRIDPTEGGGVEYIVLVGNPATNVDIATIEGGNYNGQRIRITMPMSGMGTITIKHLSGLAVPANGKFAIVCNNLADIVIAPITPQGFAWCELVYVENWKGLGTNYWVCSNVLGI